MAPSLTKSCGLFAALLITGSAAHAAQPPPDTKVEASRKAADIFVQMCMKGEVRLKPTSIDKIGRKDLPGYVRGWYKGGEIGEYYHIHEGPLEAYGIHYILPKPQEFEYKEVCAVVGQNLDSNEAAIVILKALHVVFKGNAKPVSGGEWLYNDITADFEITIKPMGNYKSPYWVIQSSVYNEDQKAQIIKNRQEDERKKAKAKSKK